MRKSQALTKTLHFHAVVLHRIECLLDTDPVEAVERMDYLERLCVETVDRIAGLRLKGENDREAFIAAVAADLNSLAVAPRL